MASSNQVQNQFSSIAQRFQSKLRTPSGLAAVASLGLHGLLFALLPFLPYATTKAKEPDIRRTVDMVELTPAEQKRLPEFSTLPPIELPPIAQPPKAGSSDLFSFSNIPQTPSSSLPQTSDSLLTPPPLPIFIPPLPAPAEAPSFSIQIPTTPQIAPAAPIPAPEVSPSTAASPSATPSPEESPTVAVEPGPASESETSESSPAPRTQEQIRQDLVARQQELRELYTYNPSGTGVAAAQTTFADWFYERLGKTGAAFDQRQEVEIEAEYPRIACPLKQSRSAVIGAIVDSKNQIVGDPEVVQSSGYQLFNQEALQAIQSYGFENSTSEEQLFLVTVKFEYSQDICPAGLAPIEPAG